MFFLLEKKALADIASSTLLTMTHRTRFVCNYLGLISFFSHVSFCPRLALSHASEGYFKLFGSLLSQYLIMPSAHHTARVQVAILDDYQGVALTSANWAPLQDRVEIDVFRDTLTDEDDLVQRLGKYEIICAMRERTKFPPSLLDRLPKLR